MLHNSNSAGSNSLKEAQALCEGRKNAYAVTVDVKSEQGIRPLIQGADLVISLVPATAHVLIAQLCIEIGRHFVSASYVSPQMAALDSLAKERGIILLNEIGLDPGLDHCSAMDVIDKVQSRGAQVTAFISFCGGLPAPMAAADVPFSYKFAWSPKGVLSAALQPALFQIGQNEMNSSVMKRFEGEALLSRGQFSDIRMPAALDAYSLPILEGLPNRNSINPYLDLYNLRKNAPDGPRTMLRGTLRYMIAIKICYIRV